MHPDAEPHQVIRHEAVEDRAQELLNRERDISFEAEERVRGQHVRRHNRGDERQAIRGGRDVAICQARLCVGAGGIEQRPGDRCRNLEPRRRDINGERLNLFAFHDRVAGGADRATAAGGRLLQLDEMPPDVRSRSQ